MEIIQKTWNFLPADEELAVQISKQTNVSNFIAQALINRGIDNVRDAWDFLYAGENRLEDPFLLKNMDCAVKRIALAVKEEQKIVVYGDYDVDGITSCAVLFKTLKELGANAAYYIPDRQSEGYGLNIAALERLIAEGAKLVITVDCGIASYQEVEDTRSRLDIIITDHHQPKEELPPAHAIINPKQKDCFYPDKNLAGVGVAFKLCQALWQYFKKNGGDCDESDTFLRYLDLVAIGTIADIVPLVGENRLLVKLGLQEIKKTTNIGLQELIIISSLSGEKIDSGAVGYILAPRLNAAGRMNCASLAVELLLAEDRQEAIRLAGILNKENSARQLAEKDILAKAEEQLTSVDLEKDKVLVVSGREWHLGVIGIVASRLAEKYCRPVVMISVDGDVGKGSCRSIASFDIYAALEKCAGLLTQFGGHRQAAGITIERDKIDSLREMLNSIALAELTQDDYLPVLNIDALVTLNQINSEFMDELALLAPHGAGNPSPVLASSDISISDVRTMGQFSQHLKLRVKKQNTVGPSSANGVNPSNHTFDVVAWNFGSLAKSFCRHEYIDIVFYPKYNEWQGNINIQLTACDIRVKPAYSPTLPNDRGALTAPTRSSFREEAYNTLDRNVIGGIYLLLKKEFCSQSLSFRVTSDTIADRLYYFAKIIINPQAVDTALTILQELNLLSYQLDADWYRIHMLPAPSKKLQLTQSPTYRLIISGIEGGKRSKEEVEE